MRKNLGATDRTRLDRYLDNVSELERRIKAVEARNTSGEPRELPDAPAGVPDLYSEHIKLMFDLQVLALESDMTRIMAFKTGRDAQNRVFPESEIEAAVPPRLAPRQPRRADHGVQQDLQVPRQPARLLPHEDEGDDGRRASLLDKSLVIFGSPMADANIHNHRRCPLVLFGHGNGMLKGNMHLKAADATPMANVFLTADAQPGCRRPAVVRRQHRRVLAGGAVDDRSGVTTYGGRGPIPCDFVECSQSFCAVVLARRLSVPPPTRRSPTLHGAATSTRSRRC